MLLGHWPLDNRTEMTDWYKSLSGSATWIGSEIENAALSLSLTNTWDVSNLTISFMARNAPTPSYIFESSVVAIMLDNGTLKVTYNSIDYNVSVLNTNEFKHFIVIVNNKVQVYQNEVSILDTNVTSIFPATINGFNINYLYRLKNLRLYDTVETGSIDMELPSATLSLNPSLTVIGSANIFLCELKVKISITNYRLTSLSVAVNFTARAKIHPIQEVSFMHSCSIPHTIVGAPQYTPQGVLVDETNYIVPTNPVQYNAYQKSYSITYTMKALNGTRGLILLNNGENYTATGWDLYNPNRATLSLGYNYVYIDYSDLWKEHVYTWNIRYDPWTLECYVDGIKYTVNMFGGSTIIFGLFYLYRVGGYNDREPTINCSGYVKNYISYNRFLFPEEIQELYLDLKSKNAFELQTMVVSISFTVEAASRADIQVSCSMQITISLQIVHFYPKILISMTITLSYDNVLDNLGSGNDAVCIGESIKTTTFRFIEENFIADTRFQLPTTYDWILLETTDINGIEDTIGPHIWTDNCNRPMTYYDDEVTTGTVRAMHYIASTGRCDLYENNELVFTNAPFTFPIGNWKISQQPIVPSNPTFAFEVFISKYNSQGTIKYGFNTGVNMLILDKRTNVPLVLVPETIDNIDWYTIPSDFDYNQSILFYSWDIVTLCNSNFSGGTNNYYVGGCKLYYDENLVNIDYMFRFIGHVYTFVHNFYIAPNIFSKVESAKYAFNNLISEYVSTLSLTMPLLKYANYMFSNITAATPTYFSADNIEIADYMFTSYTSTYYPTGFRITNKCISLKGFAMLGMYPWQLVNENRFDSSKVVDFSYFAYNAATGGRSYDWYMQYNVRRVQLPLIDFSSAENLDYAFYGTSLYRYTGLMMLDFPRAKSMKSFMQDCGNLWGYNGAAYGCNNYSVNAPACIDFSYWLAGNNSSSIRFTNIHDNRFVDFTGVCSGVGSTTGTSGAQIIGYGLVGDLNVPKAEGFANAFGSSQTYAGSVVTGSRPANFSNMYGSSITCIKSVDTTNKLTTNMFGASVVAPTAAEQLALITYPGTEYINPGACP